MHWAIDFRHPARPKTLKFVSPGVFRLQRMAHVYWFKGGVADEGRFGALGWIFIYMYKQGRGQSVVLHTHGLLSPAKAFY